MVPDEQELINELTETEKELQEAKRMLSDAKRRWTDAETLVINAKIRKDKITESLRALRAQKVIAGEDYDLYDDEDSGR